MIGRDETLLLDLIKAALGKGAPCGYPDAADWDALFNLSVRQCVPALVLDGLQRLYGAAGHPDNARMSAEGRLCKLRWAGLVMKMEQQYALHWRTVAELAAFYEGEGIGLMLLKGIGLSLYWPRPDHRPVGDIDVFLTEKRTEKVSAGLPVWKRADRAMKEKLGIVADNSHHHHSVYTCNGVMVENHYDFVNVHSHRSNRRVEADFKRLAADGGEKHICADGTGICFPSPLLNALYVVRHSACHFAAEGMNLRQLLDYALFVEKRHGDIDWDFFWTRCRDYGMEKYVLCMNEIAVERLGFGREIFHTPEEYSGFGSRQRELVDRVLDDIFFPQKPAGGKRGLSYVLARFRLWRDNLWKHRLVYSDSVPSTFVAQIKSHLMRPATIFRT